MGNFLKVLFNNLLEGPSTDPYPLGQTFTPERLRGKCVIDPDLCVGCGVCKAVCTAGAIDIRQMADASGYTITVWRNACCLCASCRHYCPTGAMTITNDWHSAQPQSEKYECLERHDIKYVPCAECGALFRPAPLKLLQKLYASNKEVDAEKLHMLCPKCRMVADAKRTAAQKNQLQGKEQAKAAVNAAPNGQVIKLEQMPETVKAEKPTEGGASERVAATADNE